MGAKISVLGLIIYISPISEVCNGFPNWNDCIVSLLDRESLIGFRFLPKHFSSMLVCNNQLPCEIVFLKTIFGSFFRHVQFWNEWTWLVFLKTYLFCHNICIKRLEFYAMLWSGDAVKSARKSREREGAWKSTGVMSL